METRKIRIYENIARIQSRIEVAAKKFSRDPREIELVAVTKNVAIQDVRFAIDAGIRNIAESKIQEAKKKFSQIGSQAIWHMIGHLQTNKAKPAAEFFDVVQSIDSFRIADALDKAASMFHRMLKVCIEVNVGQEQQKFGIMIKEVYDLVHYVSKKKNLIPSGLMCMAPYTSDAEQTRPFFKQMSTLFQQYKNEIGDQWCYLSMGMTHDFEIAIEEGSNMVRIGNGIFHTGE